MNYYIPRVKLPLMKVLDIHIAFISHSFFSKSILEQPAEKAKLQQDDDLKQLLLLTEKQNKKRDEKVEYQKEKTNKSSKSSGLVKKEDTEKLKQKQNSKKGKIL